MHVVGKSMNDVYKQLCGKLAVQGQEVAGTHELANAGFTLLDIEDNIATVRKGFSFAYMLGEMAWYWCGRADVGFIAKFSKFWEKISDDGETSRSAYGDIVFDRYGFDQVQQVIDVLKADPTSRRALINFNVPNRRRAETKDEICTIALVFQLRGGKLDCTGIMRSNDAWLGTPYDVVFFTSLQKYIADCLGVGYGRYMHFAVSLHLYDRNLADARDVWANGGSAVKARFDLNRFIEHVDNIEAAVDVMDAAGAKKFIYDYAVENGILELGD